MSRTIKAITIDPESGRPQFNALTCSPLEAAALLGVGKDAVYELIHSRQLPTRKIGRNFRIPVSALQAWLERAAE